MDSLRTHLALARPELLRTARRSLRNPAWAEDAVSETLLAALQKPPGFTDPPRVRSWLHGVLRNKLADQLRQHLGATGGTASLDADGDAADQDIDALHDCSPCSDPVRQLADRQVMGALDAQLARLPEAQAKAFVMRECRGIDTDDICQAMALSPGNLSVMLHRARNRLRQGLAAHWA